jgi:hypothetical protein
MHTNAHHLRSERLQFEPLSAIPSRLEFEEFDDFAGDVSAVARAIERDGIIAPDYGMFMFD